MGGEAILFLLALVISSALLFAAVFFVILFADLECDYINPIDLCNKLNALVLPEMVAHAVLCLLFLLRFSVTALLVNIPLLAYNAYKSERLLVYF